ncbi:hypothetical protein KP509_35G000300 [Ceratopteris richardii]|uniref:Uncharacterized protein n=1 Tax=Ceratopteris richardii TaxID=49495 RepID=A0A8T2QDV0_CERRI|nr:hypothetical protein KP509_35G000300 [Ceratopteris richardii]
MRELPQKRGGAMDEGDAENGFEHIEVVEEEVCMVKPAAEKTSLKILGQDELGAKLESGIYQYLSNLDLCWRGAPYTRRILFYERGCADGLPRQWQETAIVELKGSLARVLQEFYPAAGRLVECVGRPFIHCDNQGVEFIVAHMNAPLSLLSSSRFNPRPFFSSLIRRYPLPKTPSHLLPLVSIQVTKLDCGGLAIGMSFSNVLADGHSIWQFMNSWAACARNEPLSVIPYHRREALTVEYSSHATTNGFSLPVSNDISESQRSPLSVKICKFLHVTLSMIDRMKEQASSNCDAVGEAYFSNYDVLCAMLWKAVVIAKAEWKLGENLTSICVLGDMRFRVKPELPRGYFGNATIFDHASSTQSEVENGPFHVIAGKIHEACRACNEPRLWAMLKLLEEAPDHRFDRDTMPCVGSSINVISSPKFKVYDVDFGWGNPLAVRTAYTSMSEDIVLFPGSNGGIDVCLFFPTSLAEKILDIFHKLISNTFI